MAKDTANKPLFELAPRQAELIAASEDEILFGGGAGSGKSYSMIIKALGLNNVGIRHPEYRALLVRRSYEDLDTILKYQRRIYPFTSSPPPVWREQAKEWQWPNGAVISMGYLANEIDLLRYIGNEYAFIGVEEVCDTIPKLTWWQLLLSRCRTDIPGLKPMLVGTANPKGVGKAWVMAHWAIAPDGRSTWQEVHTDAFDIGGVTIPAIIKTRRYIQSLISDNTLWDTMQRAMYAASLAHMSEADRTALLEGRWDYHGEEDLLLIPRDVQIYAGRPARAHALAEAGSRPVGRRIIGVDPAHLGRDSTVLLHRRLDEAFNLQRRHGLNQMQLAAWISTVIYEATQQDGSTPIVNIDYAMGIGVGERLREIGHKINIIHFNSRPLDPDKYTNKRAEMFGEMAAAMGRAVDYRIPPDPALIAQLSAILVERDSSGRLKIASKEEIKKLTDHRFDEADALALTYATHSGFYDPSYSETQPTTSIETW